MKRISITLIAIFLTHGIYAQKTAKTLCMLWKPKSFCISPDSIKLPRIIKCDSTTEHYLTCDEINKNSSYKTVRLKLTRKNGKVFRLKSNFSNISLIRKTDGEILHPYAILWSFANVRDNNNNLKFLSSDFTTKSYKVKFKFMKYVDLILIFIQADLGDKIIIDDYLETDIQY
jgi:hypothetical protein